MAQKVSNKQILAASNNGQTFKDKLVQLKPGDTNGSSVKVRLKAVGEAISFNEYQPRVRDYENQDANGRPKIVKKDFPDSHLTRSFTRIGHDDPEQCPWKEMGFTYSKRYAMNVLERQPDGTYVPKVLQKGSTVFKPLAEWEEARRQERLEEGDDSITCFLGGRTAPEFVVTCTRDNSKPGKVAYSVSVRTKDMTITDEQIAALKKINTPSADEIDELKAGYDERNEDGTKPEFEDWMECGHNISTMFKFTPPKNADEDDDDDDDTVEASIPDDDDDDDLQMPPSSDDDDDDDDDDTNIFAEKSSGDDDDDDDNEDDWDSI
jgi:hypothetical protein